MQPYNLKLVSNLATTMTRLRSDYYNKPPYSLAAMEVLLSYTGWWLRRAYWVNATKLHKQDVGAIQASPS